MYIARRVHRCGLVVAKTQIKACDVEREDLNRKRMINLDTWEQRKSQNHGGTTGFRSRFVG